MKKWLSAALIPLFLSACMQTKPNPIPLSQNGDETKSCSILYSEMQETIKVKEDSHSARNRQIGTNVALGVVGIPLLFIPWFFMDTSNAHTVDMKAAESRFNRLNAIGADKRCADVQKYYDENKESMAIK